MRGSLHYALRASVEMTRSLGPGRRVRAVYVPPMAWGCHGWGTRLTALCLVQPCVGLELREGEERDLEPLGVG
jgi:hypothetical protein